MAPKRKWIYGEEPDVQLFPGMVRPPSEPFSVSHQASNNPDIYGESLRKPAPGGAVQEMDLDADGYGTLRESDVEDSDSYSRCKYRPILNVAPKSHLILCGDGVNIAETLICLFPILGRWGVFGCCIVRF